MTIPNKIKRYLEACAVKDPQKLKEIKEFVDRLCAQKGIITYKGIFGLGIPSDADMNQIMKNAKKSISFFTGLTEETLFGAKKDDENKVIITDDIDLLKEEEDDDNS